MNVTMGKDTLLSSSKRLALKLSPHGGYAQRALYKGLQQKSDLKGDTDVLVNANPCFMVF